MPQITVYQRTENDSPECVTWFRILELNEAEEQMRKILSK